jgi:non-homologous end joining protein Ku
MSAMLIARIIWNPNDKAGLDAFAVIRDAMHDKGMVALGRVVLSKRERVLMLQPWGKGLLGTTLRYPYEVRGEESRRTCFSLPSISSTRRRRTSTPRSFTIAMSKR